jgi:trigger factor
MVQSSFAQAVAQEKLRPAGPPSIEPDVERGQGQERFAYTAVFEVMPEVELASVADRRIQRFTAEVEDSDLNDMIERLRKQRQTWQEVDRPAQQGDQVQISFQGTIDGEVFEGGSAENVPLVLGSGMMIEGFESELVGAAAGEKRTLNLRFPDNYRAEKLAGKPVVFEVEVTRVSEPKLPEVDEEFARSFGVETGDVTQLRAEIRGNMERELRQRIQSKLKNEVMDLLLDAHQVPTPKALVDEEVESLREQTRQSAGGGSMELPRNLFEEHAKRRVALGLIVAEVVKQNDIKVDQERVNNTIAEIASSYEKPQEVIDFYSNSRKQRASVENLVLEDQVVDWVLEHAQVEEVLSTFKTLTGGES